MNQAPFRPTRVEIVKPMPRTYERKFLKEILENKKGGGIPPPDTRLFKTFVGCPLRDSTERSHPENECDNHDCLYGTCELSLNIPEMNGSKQEPQEPFYHFSFLNKQQRENVCGPPKPRGPRTFPDRAAALEQS